MVLAKKNLSKDALTKMQNYSWPGNVRELENILHRTVLMSSSEEIKADDIQIKERSGGLISDNNQNYANEKQVVFNTLGYCFGDLTKAANILGISINILKEKLQRYSK